MNESLERLDGLISAKHSNICQITAMREGKVILERCYHGFTPTDAFNTMSVTKSVVSLLVGIAMHKGFVQSADQPVLDFFPDYPIKRGETTIQQVTLRHLLTMTAPYKYRFEPFGKVYASDDWTRAALDLLGGRKGLTGDFRYSTVGLQILTGILRNATGVQTLDFANRYLFEPLGIAPRSSVTIPGRQAYSGFIFGKTPKEKGWVADPQGVNAAGWGLCLSASELVRLGQLCLDGGTVGDSRILSREWIREMTTPFIQCGKRYGNMRYGYLWWLPDENAPTCAAIGDGGNVLYIDPQRYIAVGVTATFKPRVFDRAAFIQQHIVPLLEG